MMKLKRYLKPYIGFALAAIVLMFCQAAVDLNLPNLMSDIVNVGIQQGGITEAAPKAVSAEGLQLMSAFMSEEDRALAQSQYVLAEQANMTADEWDRFVTDWPKVSDTDVYRQIPNLDDSTQAQLDSAFSRASYALMTVVKDLAEQSGQDIAAGDTDSKAMDMSKLGELVPMLAMLPQGMVDDAIAAAAATPESMLSQTAAVFTKGFYMQLGADTDAMQTSYIFRTGGKMLLMALLLAVCAISVGFCGSRMGAGIARDLRRDIFAKVTSFTNNEYDKFGTASLITRSTNDVTQVQGLVTMGLRIMCYAPIIGIGGTIMALSKSVSMAWVIALAVVLILGLICTISAIAMPRFKIMQQLVDKLNLVSRENLSGMMVIRAFATQDFEEKRFDKANKDLADNNLFVVPRHGHDDACDDAGDERRFPADRMGRRPPDRGFRHAGGRHDGLHPVHHADHYELPHDQHDVRDGPPRLRLGGPHRGCPCQRKQRAGRAPAQAPAGKSERACAVQRRLLPL